MADQTAYDVGNEDVASGPLGRNQLRGHTALKAGPTAVTCNRDLVGGYPDPWRQREIATVPCRLELPLNCHREFDRGPGGPEGAHGPVLGVLDDTSTMFGGVALNDGNEPSQLGVRPGILRRSTWRSGVPNVDENHGQNIAVATLPPVVYVAADLADTLPRCHVPPGSRQVAPSRTEGPISVKRGV